MIARHLEPKIVSALFKGKTIVLYGPRQVGKTTLVRKVLDQSGKRTKFFDAESAAVRQTLRADDFESVRKSVEGYDLVAIDEAQKIENVGSLLKLLHDHLPNLQVIATGSSSFDLSQKTRESMAGRVREFFMSPLLVSELLADMGYAELVQKRDLLIRYGSYPMAFETGTSREELEDGLLTFADAILSKDVLELENVRKSPVFTKLLTLLALQVGSEVSYSELARTLGINVATVQKYVYLLEESFIVFTLRAFSRNLRNELKKSQKIYFYDVGIRNALIRNFNPPDLRTDTGALWENFIIAERVKHNRSAKRLAEGYFWRTLDRKEIDYVEAWGDHVDAFEIKWGANRKAGLPEAFRKAYPTATFSVVNSDDWVDACAVRE